MDDLPEAILEEIIKRLTSTSDLNSVSLVSKRLCAVDSLLRDTAHLGCGVCPVTVALTSLCSRFPNLSKVEFNYSGWNLSHGLQLNNQGLRVFSSCCPLLTDLTLSFCSHFDDSGLGFLASFKKLAFLRLNTVPAVTSTGLLSVAVGCKSLSALHLIDCGKVDGAKWPEYLGMFGSLEELVVRYCKRVSQFDLLKFSQGWMKLQKFEFQTNNLFVSSYDPRDPSYVAHCDYRYDLFCGSLKDLTLGKIVTRPEAEMGLCCLLRKCNALEKLCLYYVQGLKDNDIITLSHNCSNLRSISLRQQPVHNDLADFRTPLTDDSLKALSLRCPMLESVELIFLGCDNDWPEIGFTQEGLVMLIQSCPIRNLVLSGANIFDDEGMKALSSARFLESLELTDCFDVTDAGMRLLADCPCLINLTLRQCENFTDDGVTEVARARNLESLIIEGCCSVNREAVQGTARSVVYKHDYPGLYDLGRA